jgi:hypothetical protein
LVTAGTSTLETRVETETSALGPPAPAELTAVTVTLYVRLGARPAHTAPTELFASTTTVIEEPFEVSTTQMEYSRMGALPVTGGGTGVTTNDALHDQNTHGTTRHQVEGPRRTNDSTRA